MKKIIYIFLFSILTSLTISSCTEEQVTPKLENGGGKDIEIIKG